MKLNRHLFSIQICLKIFLLGHNPLLQAPVPVKDIFPPNLRLQSTHHPHLLLTTRRRVIKTPTDLLWQSPSQVTESLHRNPRPLLEGLYMWVYGAQRVIRGSKFSCLFINYCQLDQLFNWFTILILRTYISLISKKSMHMRCSPPVHPLWSHLTRLFRAKVSADGLEGWGVSSLQTPATHSQTSLETWLSLSAISSVNQSTSMAETHSYWL